MNHAENEEGEHASRWLKVAVPVVVVLTVLAFLAILEDRRYTPTEQALWDLYLSLRLGVSHAGTSLTGIVTSAGNSSAAEINRISLLAASRLLVQAGKICQALEGIDRRHRAEWSDLGGLLGEMWNEWLPGFDPRSIDHATAKLIVDSGSSIHELGVALTEKETGALRNDATRSGTVKGVMVDADRLRAFTAELRQLIEATPSI
jgi:hypothetical protein